MTIVFCDLGTPTGSAPFNVYENLRHELVARGMDPARVRFIHEANNDRKKALLFEQCRTGQVDVIIGSTSKMGVGTNIQTRAVALHHLDCPWRPADIEQREGRILRQGNLNPEVGIYRYVVEGSFDAYSWQTVERKAKFIDQIMTAPSTSARSRTSATTPSASTRSRPSPLATRSSSNAPSLSRKSPP
ncbi:helicase-related protein [Janibacter sp. RAF20_2_2]|uniref:helicase-related protein n=1 Tax=unclassified Janibacter TaxID=2649294 RepID=UPI003F91FC29